MRHGQDLHGAMDGTAPHWQRLHKMMLKLACNGMHIHSTHPHLETRQQDQTQLPPFFCERISGAKGLPAASDGGALNPSDDAPPPGSPPAGASLCPCTSSLRRFFRFCPLIPLASPSAIPLPAGLTPELAAAAAPSEACCGACAKHPMGHHHN